MDCRRRPSALLVFVLAACGPTVASGGAEDAGSAGSSSAAGDSSGGAADSTGGSICENYPPEQSGTGVALKLFHQGTAPVFFRPYGCGGTVTFDVYGTDDTPMPYLLADACTPSTCGGFLAAGTCEIGCDDCAPPQVGRLEPGAISDGAWPGYQLTELSLLPMCLPGIDCPTSCVRPDPVASGTYTIELTVYRTCTGACACDGVSSGVCTIWGEAELSDPAAFAATIEYPSQLSADITITD